jgi:hypothetical protein
MDLDKIIKQIQKEQAARTPEQISADEAKAAAYKAERQAEKEEYAALLLAAEGLVARAGAAKSPSVLGKVLGHMLVKSSYNPHDLSQNQLNWAVDAYVAAKVGPLAARFLKLHAFLVKRGLDKQVDFNHADRYGMALADEEKWKTMAFQTQNYTYMVLLEATRVFSGSMDNPVSETGWKIHLRFTTKDRYGREYTRTKLEKLTFLKDKAAVVGKYKDSNCDYFQYKDGRDRGFLCTVEPEMDVNEGYRAENALWGYTMLEGVIYDLASHCDCLEEYEEDVD